MKYRLSNLYHDVGVPLAVLVCVLLTYGGGFTAILFAVAAVFLTACYYLRQSRLDLQEITARLREDRRPNLRLVN